MGPAGGIIFFDKGQKTEGWRYLEAAPVIYEFTAPWGFYGTAVNGTGTSIGSGKKNTEIMVSMSNSEMTQNAAFRCSKLEIKGFKDWFLPSKDELDFMYRALHRQNMGFFKDDWYWSSSVWDEDNDKQWNSQYTTWKQRFSDGSQFTNANTSYGYNRS